MTLEGRDRTKLDVLIRLGDRFRVTRTVDPKHVMIVGKAPAHTQGANGCLPAETVIVAFDQTPGATAFAGYPQDYQALESSLVPADVRAWPSYAQYYLVFDVDDVGELLEPLAPMDPRPENRLPQLGR
jgi:hypothetical protein